MGMGEAGSYTNNNVKLYTNKMFCFLSFVYCSLDERQPKLEVQNRVTEKQMHSIFRL